MLKTLLTSVVAACSLPASAATFLQDFSDGSTTTYAANSGSAGQTFSIENRSTPLITADGKSVPSIDGNSLFTTIYTTAASGGSSTYGVIFQTVFFPVGPLSSSSATDYDIIFDFAANGFAVREAAAFIHFKTSGGADLFGGQTDANVNSGVSPDVLTASSGDGVVSVSIPLEDFSAFNAVDPYAFNDVGQMRLLLRVKSLDGDYNAVGTENVLVYDNAGVSFTGTAVPEPATTAIIGLGSLGLLSFFGRRTRDAELG